MRESARLMKVWTSTGGNAALYVCHSVDWLPWDDLCSAAWAASSCVISCDAGDSKVPRIISFHIMQTSNTLKRWCCRMGGGISRLGQKLLWRPANCPMPNYVSHIPGPPSHMPTCCAAVHYGGSPTPLWSNFAQKLGILPNLPGQ